VLANVLAGLDEPLRNRPGHRRAHDGVAELLLRQLVRGAAILKARFETPHGIDRRLVVGFGDLPTRFGGVAIDLREQAAAAELLRAREGGARVIAIRRRLANRRDLVVGRRLFVLEMIDAELRFDLPQRALGAFGGQLELAWLEPHQNIARPYVGPELDRYGAN